MKNVIIFLFVAFGLNGYCQIINFPDPNFKKALMKIRCVDTDGDNIVDVDADLNNDGEIDKTEAEQVLEITIFLSEIYDLTGIEHFKNLKILNCPSNKIEFIDVSNLVNLTEIRCYNNRIKSFIVKNVPLLQQLLISKNEIEDIDISQSPNLISLNCSYNKLKSLNLINNPNLVTLYCDNNKIESLDLTTLNKLIEIRVGNNNIDTLSFPNHPNLLSLDFRKNLITSLQIKNSPKITHIYGSNNRLNNFELANYENIIEINVDTNHLSELKISSAPKLKILRCSNNKITKLDIANYTNLDLLDCNQNKLTSIDTENLKYVNYLNVSNNMLTTLNIDNCKQLDSINCSNNLLSELNANNLPNLRRLLVLNNKLRSIFFKNEGIYVIDFRGNDSLKIVCTSELHYPGLLKDPYFLSLKNCLLTTYCNFTPGGLYYILKSDFKYDVSGVCTDSSSNYSLKKIVFFNNSNFTKQLLFTDFNGKLTLPLPNGSYKFSLPDDAAYLRVSPIFENIFINNPNDTIVRSYCISPKILHRYINITVIPLTPPSRPGFETKYKIVWENLGTLVENGTLNFTYDERFLDFISATQTADQVADGIIKWNFANLLPFEKREITVTLKVNGPTDTPAVNVGDKLYLTASILDNIFTLENTVVGSYDPNDKTCLQGDRIHPDMIGKYVDFLIRFENTGTYAAENIVVKDIIDTKRFDVNSLHITDASHEVYTRIAGNKVEFIFENIQLPFDDANNDGYIAFKIKTLPSLVLGDSLKNLADIYFDYNFPIRTNEAQTTIVLPSFTKDFNTEFNIYPNPVRDILYIESDENWNKAEIYDISGRIIWSFNLNGLSIDVSGLENGTYFVRLKDREKVGVVKFVKL